MGPNVSALNTYRVGVGDQGFAEVGDLGAAGEAKRDSGEEGGGKRHNEFRHLVTSLCGMDETQGTQRTGEDGWAAEKGTPPSRSRRDQTHTEMGIQKGANAELRPRSGGW
jgi:hypothetical protein